MNFGLSLHHPYAALVARFTSPTNPSPPKLLDLGTCVGQGLRKLAFDGVPAEQLYRSDIFSDFEQAGTMLFRDEEKFAGHFIAADLLVEDAADSVGELLKTEGTWDVVSALILLHIWDYKTQVAACKRILKLVGLEKGSLLIGASTGFVKPGEEWYRPLLVLQERSIYRHSNETFVQMWNKVEGELSIKVKVQCTYDDARERAADSRNKKANGRCVTSTVMIRGDFKLLWNGCDSKHNGRNTSALRLA